MFEEESTQQVDQPQEVVEEISTSTADSNEYDPLPVNKKTNFTHYCITFIVVIF